MRALVLWLLGWIRIGLDPELKQRLDDYKADRARMQEEIRREKQGLEADAAMLAELRSQRERVKQDTKKTAEEITNLLSEVKKIDEEPNPIAGKSGSDVLRGDL